MVERFRRHDPPKFNGREGPEIMENWLRSLERTFTVMRCTDAQRVLCATYQLVEDADHWWEAYWRMRPEEERNNLTWGNFKDIIMEKYYPHSYRE